MFVLTVKGLVYYFLWFLSPFVTFQGPSRGKTMNNRLSSPALSFQWFSEQTRLSPG